MVTSSLNVTSTLAAAVHADVVVDALLVLVLDEALLVAVESVVGVLLFVLLEEDPEPPTMAISAQERYT